MTKIAQEMSAPGMSLTLLTTYDVSSMLANTIKPANTVITLCSIVKRHPSRSILLSVNKQMSLFWTSLDADF